MSRIDALLERLCPEGVPFRALGRVMTMRAGKSIAASEISAERDADHAYPCFGGNGLRGFVRTYNHDGKYLLIGRQGALCGNVKRADGKFYATEHAIVCAGGLDLDLDWAFHMLISLDLNQYATKSAQPGLAVGAIEAVRAPLPPIEVQREIVKVLDTFSKLENELAARRRQYRHYLDELLAFRGQHVRRAPLGELGQFIRGRRFTKADYVDAGGVPCIHYGEIYTRYGTAASEAISQVRPNMAGSLRYALPGDVVITDVGETVADVGKAVAWMGDEDVAIHDHCYAFRHSLNPKFVAYCMQTSSFVAEKAKYVARTKVNTLLIPGYAKITIPVPPPAEQARIVAILDRFDALVNDLSSGLPAEIKARRQQYEHYRDRLLSFKEAA